MCGIVGIFNPTQTTANVSLFEQLLYADVFRGYHSTGVFRLCPDNINTETFKKARPAGLYLYDEGWEALKGDTYPGTKGLQKLSPLYVGHNRHATIGEKTDANAHPFTEGSITLVHNGSVTKSTLSNGNKFDVDSHAICALIDEKGIDEALKEMDGAFALVWWDSSSKTLNFLRNSKRPMHICKYTDGTYAWASEEDMLKWIMSRKGSSSTVVKTLERSFELPVGYLYQLQFDGKEVVELGLTKKVLPTFSSYSSSSYYSSGTSGSSYSGGYNQEASWEKALTDAGICFEDVCEKIKVTDILFKVTNPMYTSTYGTTGRIDFELQGLQDAVDAFEDAGVVVDGFLSVHLNVHDAVEIIQYSKTKEVFKGYQDAEFLYVKPTSVYTSTMRGKKTLTISVKDVLTSLTVAQEKLVINPSELFPLHYVESKIQDKIQIEDKSKKEEGTGKTEKAEVTGENPEDKVKNLSGTEKKIKTINALNFCCGFCANPLTVNDFKKSTTWFSGETVCETCSQLAEEWSNN